MLTKEQLEFRKKGIGGSDAAAICGLDNYRTPLDVFLEKTGQVIPEDIGYKNCIKYGNYFEDFVAKLYAEEQGVKVKRVNKTLVHRTHNFMLANIDRVVVGKPIILECKTASVFGHKQWGDENSDFIPDSYLMQVAHYAAVCEVPQVDIAVYFTDHSFKICTYKRNLKLEQSLIEIERNFWENHVVRNIPPAAKNLDDIKKLYPRPDDSTVLANNDIINQLAAYKELQQQTKEINDKMQEIKANICNKMGLASVLQDPYGNKLASWDMRETNRLDTTKLKKELPEIYNQFCKKSVERYFTVK